MAAEAKNRIEQDIRSKTFAGIYLLYGDEDYLKDYYRKRLTRALIPDDNSINLNVWNETLPEPGEFLAQALTLPFFAEHRLLVVLRSGWFKGAGGNFLADRMDEIPAETVLLFVEDAVDERTKLFRTVKSAGTAVKCTHLKGKTLENWVVQQLVKEGHDKIQTRAMELFLERVGEDMQVISMELEKLYGYTYGRDTLLAEDVRAVTTVPLENQMFRMIDLIGSRKRTKVLEMYHDLLILKNPPTRILWRLSDHFMRLLQISELREQGLDVFTISEKMGLRDFIVRRLIGQCAHFTGEEMVENLKRLEQADEDIKFGRMPGEMALEQAILWITRSVE